MEQLPNADIRTICRRLERAYGNPRHGNKRDPLDELIYIILSTRTRDASYARTFHHLKQEYRHWDEALFRPKSHLTRLLAPGGLGRLKAKQILQILSLLTRYFGYATLAPLRQFADADAEEFLTALPGVGKKVAKCVMMYSLGRSVLPVDTHVHRVASRIGFDVKRRPDTSQDLIEAAVPPSLRYSFHVNAIAHGRAVCLSRSPRCSVCCIAYHCQFFLDRRS